MSDPRLRQILHHLDPPAGTRLWHGGGKVLGVLRGVSPDKAAWKPGPDRHSIWALTLHMAYWKYIVHRKIVDGPKGGFPRTPSNWPSVPVGAAAESWKKDRALLRETQAWLVAAVRDFDPARLDEDPEGSHGDYSYADLLMGIALHDVHHVAQIQLLKRLHDDAHGGAG